MTQVFVPAREALVWRNGIGFLDPGATPETLYNLAYWNEYVNRADTEMGQFLTDVRVDLVERFAEGRTLVDVGIGCGAFIQARGEPTYGFDVNLVARNWLLQRHLWLNPYTHRVPAATFWDSLEHIRDPGSMLNNVTEWVFISMPIYRDRDHCLRSKHFKPGEHCWYFTHEGFVRFMDVHDFELVETNATETALGREDVESFVFRRAD